MNQQTMEISPDGVRWLRVYVRPVAELADEPTAPLPEGWSWVCVDGRWAPVQDEGALRS